jgi:hypothetical protein
MAHWHKYTNVSGLPARKSRKMKSSSFAAELKKGECKGGW